MSTLTPESLHGILRQFFPAKNDFGTSDFLEELKELGDFGVVSQDDLVALLDKRSREVLGIDQSPMSKEEIRWAGYCSGKEDVAVRLREKRWFTFSGLLRIGMELEFGEPYRHYSENRDGIR